MELWSNVAELKTKISKACKIENGKLSILDEKAFRNDVDELVYNSTFSSDEGVKEACRWIIWEASQTLGCPSSSIHDLYMARARKEYESMTTPAINIRGMTYDIARTIAKTAMDLNCGVCLYEIARSEISYTKQRPSEYATCILAGCIKEGYKGPVFIQGDHFQVKQKAFEKNPKQAIDDVKTLIKESVEAGFYNIDLDTSTLVDLNQPTILEQQRNNFESAAELTKFIRQLEPKGITISLGGEIGEIGGKNSNVEELSAFLEGYMKTVNKAGGRVTGISKVAVQTGTSHGGVPLADGTVAKVSLDFDVLDKLGRTCVEQFKIGGVVQHGASTLPDSVFNKFPEYQTLEVHLATGFQNIVFDHKKLPKEFKDNVYKWLADNCAKERKEGQTDEQFYYKSRKKGFGPFKKEWWDLPQDIKSEILHSLADNFKLIFEKLNVRGSKKLTDKFIKTTPVHKTIPSSLL